MDKQLLNQSPLFNLTKSDFFDLSISNSANKNWDEFFEDFLLLKMHSFRTAHAIKNKESMEYFLFLVEGKFQ